MDIKGAIRETGGNRNAQAFHTKTSLQHCNRKVTFSVLHLGDVRLISAWPV
jgi:hypothetical protein